MFKNLTKIYSILDKQRRLYFFTIFFISIIVSVLETIGISLILPILTLLFDNSGKTVIDEFFFKNFNIIERKEIFTIILVSFSLVIIFKNLFVVFLTWLKGKYILNLSVFFSTNLLKVYLNKSMNFHSNINSSELVRNLNGEVKILTKSFLMSYLNIFAELVFLITISLFLLINNFTITVSVFIFFVLSSLIILSFHKNQLSKYGEIRMKYSTLSLKILKESFDSIKEIKVGNLFDSIQKNYFKFMIRTGKMNILATIYSSLPKAFFEIVIVIILSSALLYRIIYNLEIFEYIPIVGLYFFAVFRIMPSISRTINNVQSIRYSTPSFTKIYKDFDGSVTTKKLFKKIEFNDEIKFEKISFSYDNSKDIIHEAKLNIKKNTTTLIMGETGCGKTTLLDIILGFRNPTSGKIYIDGKLINLYENFYSWISKVSYTPQSIYIYDDTIEKNITLESEKKNINYKLLKQSINIAELDEYVKNSLKGLDTIIGEMGSKISGGQKQRIGIARAIYKNADLVILDECTSALDAKTEEKIILNLEKIKKEKTFIIVSHNIKNFKKIADKILIIENKSVQEKNEVK